jgi:hypothetical protein
MLTDIIRRHSLLDSTEATASVPDIMAATAGDTGARFAADVEIVGRLNRGVLNYGVVPIVETPRRAPKCFSTFNVAF